LSVVSVVTFIQLKVTRVLMPYTLITVILTVVVYYNSNIQTYPISKKYHTELYIWPKHPKTILRAGPAGMRLLENVLILHC